MQTQRNGNVDQTYMKAEQKAAQYLQQLMEEVNNQTYANRLANDFHEWKKDHIHHPLKRFISYSTKSYAKHYQGYLSQLDTSGKLERYLERSIAYLYMRDLGKALNSQGTQERINKVVQSIKPKLLAKTSDSPELFSMSSLYKEAQKEGIELTMIWVMNKLKDVSAHIPEVMDAEQAKRKLIKLIAGVLMHAVEEMPESITNEERKQRLDQAIRLGYCYGMTYPFIDDLLDAKVLSEEETKQYTNNIRTALTTGVVPDLGVWEGENGELITYIHKELREAFEYITSQQTAENLTSFLEQAYVFFQAQESDRLKSLDNKDYTNEELYIPVILKSASSRFIARSVLSTEEDEGFEERTFFYGIYNQLSDDFSDMFEDLKNGAVTPYTYFLQHHKHRSDLLNPFELYWAVITYLLHDVYEKDELTREVILDRAINGLKRYKEKNGLKRYNEVMGVFAPKNSAFHQLVQNMVKKADEVDFLDKLLRDHMLAELKKNKQEKEEFSSTVKEVRGKLNNVLPLLKGDSIENDPIIDAANHSLEGDGKRLRPIIMWMVGVKGYGLNEKEIFPLLKSLEYMHTASLIFDDLPSQDNASYRRGRPTLHRIHPIATAELTGLFLTQRAIKEQTSLQAFKPEKVVEVIRYSAKLTEEMCKGQEMDLSSRGEALSLQQLNELCYFKTGLAFEAALVMPAILANVGEAEITRLKAFAYHAGIAFQIKDDLLDVEGDETKLGKSAGMDEENNSSTFVTVLGVNEAKKEMWQHYCKAMEELENLPPQLRFLTFLLNYMIHRDY
ncbi:polyprenyl synthetase family protein [Metabacillus sp. HB246100]